MELKVKQVRAYGAGCIGCQTHDAEDRENIKFFDFFADQVAAEKFYKELGEILARNKEDEAESENSEINPAGR